MFIKICCKSGELTSIIRTAAILAVAAKSRVEFIEYYSKREDHRAHWKELHGIVAGHRDVHVERNRERQTEKCSYNY